jgi:hypothetical protein
MTPSNKRKPNYLPDLLRRIDNTALQPGSVQHVDIYHDSWCDQLHGRGPCNCHPIVSKPYTLPRHETN